MSMSQEHGCVSVKSGKIDCAAYPLGSMLFIYPYHVSYMYFYYEINVLEKRDLLDVKVIKPLDWRQTRNTKGSLGPSIFI